MSIIVNVIRSHDGKPFKNVLVDVVFSGALSGSVSGRTNSSGQAIFNSKPNREGKILVSKKVVFDGRIPSSISVSA